MQYTHEQLIDISRFNSDDITQIRRCRQEHNRLGFGYQLAFVRLLNQIPTQTPFEVINDILQRLIARQREQAKDHIYKRISRLLADNSIEKLESLINTADGRPSEFQMLKQPAGRPSPGAMLKLIERLEVIQSFGIVDIDLSWLNNNSQRALTRYAKQCTATRLRRLERNRRHAVMVCFLWQSYLNTIDSVVDMYDKLINKIY